MFVIAIVVLGVLLVSGLLGYGTLRWVSRQNSCRVTRMHEEAQDFARLRLALERATRIMMPNCSKYDVRLLLLLQEAQTCLESADWYPERRSVSIRRGLVLCTELLTRLDELD